MHINSWADRQSSRGGSESAATLSTSFCKKRCIMPGIDRDVCCCETQAATSLCIIISSQYKSPLAPHTSHIFSLSNIRSCTWMNALRRWILSICLPDAFKFWRMRCRSLSTRSSCVSLCFSACCELGRYGPAAQTCSQHYHPVIRLQHARRWLECPCQHVAFLASSRICLYKRRTRNLP